MRITNRNVQSETKIPVLLTEVYLNLLAILSFYKAARTVSFITRFDEVGWKKMCFLVKNLGLGKLHLHKSKTD